MSVIDIAAVVRSWANGLTGSLAGPGRPVALGFVEHRLRSPGRGVFGLIGAELDPSGLDAEGTINRAAVTVSLFSATDPRAALTGALATANALLGINQARPVAAGARLLMVSGVTISDAAVADAPGANASTRSDDEPVYQITADVYVTSA